MNPPVGYAAVTTPEVATSAPAYGDVSVSVPWICAIVRTGAAAATSIANVVDAACPPASATSTVTVARPAAVGVPPIVSPLRDSPAGRPEALQV